MLKKAKILEAKRKELEKSQVKIVANNKTSSTKIVPNNFSTGRFGMKPQAKHINKPLMSERMALRPIAKDYELETKPKEITRSRNTNESCTIKNYIKNATTQKARSNMSTNNLRKYEKHYWNNSLEIQEPSQNMVHPRELSNTIEIDSSSDPFFNRIGQKHKRMSEEVENLVIECDEPERFEVIGYSHSSKFKRSNRLNLPSNLDTVLEKIGSNDHINKTTGEKRLTSKP